MSASDFWSRRKAGVREEARAERAARDQEVAALREAEMAERPDAEILQELGLPDPDSLELGDDVRGFLAEAVPARLRERALRRLWRTNPVLANLDGLVDYGEDYTDAAGAVEAVRTAYEVGRGFAAQAAEALDNVASDTPEAECTEAAAFASETDTALAERPATLPEAAEPFPSAEHSQEEEISYSRPRRMSYRFEQ